MNTYSKINSGQWTTLNGLRKKVRSMLVRRNSYFYAKACKASSKTAVQLKGADMLTAFDKTEKPILNRRIDELDEYISDFIVDHISQPDNRDSAFINAVMEFYEAITSFRT